MSEPREPKADPGGPAAEPEPPQAGAQPSTEPEPTPSTAPPPESQPQPGQAQRTEQMFQPGPPAPAGHYVWVPEGARRQRSFGPAFGRFVRNRGTHLVAAVVVGAVVGGGTVAIVDNIADHQRPTISREGQSGGPFGGGSGHRVPGFRFGSGGQGSGN